MTEPVRLQRYLAAAGVAARRKAEQLITAGRVKVNGKIVTVLGTKIDPDNDSITVDGEAVVALDHFYVLLNKPKACITAVSDDRGRPTVMDYLPNVPVPVKPVGRLDFYTEGVLLLTNDGELAAKLLAPGSHVPKTYHVKVHGQLMPEHLAILRDGVRLDDGTTTMPAEIAMLPGESKHTWVAITIHEGKHRQIHRMIEALGFRVDKLQRVAFANLTFHDLRIGDARELGQQELNQLRDLVGLDHSAVARGRWRALREGTDIPRRARAKARAEAESDDVPPIADAAAPREPRSFGKRNEPARESPKRGGQGRTFGKRAEPRDARSDSNARPPSRSYSKRGDNARPPSRTYEPRGATTRPYAKRESSDARPPSRTYEPRGATTRPYAKRESSDARPSSRSYSKRDDNSARLPSRSYEKRDDSNARPPSRSYEKPAGGRPARGPSSRPPRRSSGSRR